MEWGLIFNFFTTDFSRSDTEILNRLGRETNNTLNLFLFPCYSVPFRGEYFFLFRIPHFHFRIQIIPHSAFPLPNSNHSAFRNRFVPFFKSAIPNPKSKIESHFLLTVLPCRMPLPDSISRSSLRRVLTSLPPSHSWQSQMLEVIRLIFLCGVWSPPGQKMPNLVHG